MPALPTFTSQCPVPRGDGLLSLGSNPWTTAFIVLFVWRYLRQVVHIVAFWAYHPAEPLVNPKITPADVTVIIPTIDPHNVHFQAGLASACRNLPAKVIVVTAGDVLRKIAVAAIAKLLAGALASKTLILACMDDHVLWKDTFLKYALPAFERDPSVGIVGTNKRVIREAQHSSLKHRVLNMVQCLYLERHNFEIRSSNAVDGGVFVVSGRTSLTRSSIFKDPNFVHNFLNDYFFFGLVGPLAVDDDNFITRWCIAHGWRVKIQYRPETLITTSLGSYDKFSGGLIRWVRTTWRSNSVSLLSWHVWRAQPWSIYAVYLSLFTNFALFYDPLLLYAFAKSDLSGYQSNLGSSLANHGADNNNVGATDSKNLFSALLPLILWMFVCKMVKPFAYFWRNPQDLVMLPAYFIFTWAHSLIKLKGLLTICSAKWEGRDLASLNADLAKNQAYTRRTMDSTSKGSGFADDPPSISTIPSTITSTSLAHMADDDDFNNEGQDAGHSTVLLADLATDGATTSSGEIIRSILQGTSPAVVDGSIVYTRPDAVLEAGEGGLDTAACQQDTCCIWSYIVPHMVAAFSDKNTGRCTALARSAIRIGFHDAGAWNTSTPVPPFAMDGSVGSGGADGSILLSDGELQRSENRGMGNIGNLILSWHDEFRQYAPQLSVADLIQVGSMVATVSCPGGPRIRAFVGRPDVDSRIPPPPHHLLPQPTANISTMIDLFAAKTFTVTDLVALVGAHTVSHQYFADPAYAGLPQDTTDGVFDTKIYSEMETKTPPVGVYHIASDKVLATDAATQQLWKDYAQPNAQTKWTDAYATAYFRLSLLGVQNLNKLTDCSGVLPQSKAVP
ncbi:hypothetical protein SEUCBS140593_003469 [Sporothrix eucalyptigena]|uniref:Peroxidase n=1 Tax=Sporothrix eucalyptigena TaxID=1812306 RepID=A0ABP0BF52_9PEZI